MKKIVGLIAFLFVGTANATTIGLSWTTTAAALTGSIPGVVGEEIVTTFTVDNGGTSILSQSWDAADFLSYRIEGASGWWIESSFIDLGDSSGMFSTDVLGNVISAGDWYGGYFIPATITTSWAGDLSGGWWNNGSNEVVCSSGAADCVWANNVGDNIIGSSWIASSMTSVPEPATISLLGLGLVGFGFARKRKPA